MMGMELPSELSRTGAPSSSTHQQQMRGHATTAATVPGTCVGNSRYSRSSRVLAPQANSTAQNSSDDIGN